jgi:large subunit ribosomal protein L10
VNRAVKGTDYEGLEKYLEGPSTFAFSYGDATVAPRTLAKLRKDLKNLDFKAGLVAGALYDAKGMELVAEIPPRDVLLSKLLGSFKAPVSSFARVINAIAEQKAE